MKPNTILEKFNLAQNRLVFQSSDLSLESISNMVSAGAIDIQPKYQRRERWDRFKQSALIESFLLNIPVPPIFLAEDEYGKYSVIDGKQRITSIYNFVTNKHKLERLEKFTEIEGYNFDQLPEQLNNALRIRPYLRVITLLKQSDPNLKYEVFNRLNTGGDKLLPQEIRNAAFEGEFNDLLVQLSESTFLRSQFNIETESARNRSKIYREMLDVEYVLRFFTLREFWASFPGNMRNAMDQFMEKNRRMPTTEVLKNATVFKETLEICQQIWGEDAFKRPNGRNEIIQGIYDVQTVSLSFYLDRKTDVINKKDIIRNKFSKRYEEDKEFEDSIRQFTSNIRQVAYRIGTMNSIILEAIG